MSSLLTFYLDETIVQAVKTTASSAGLEVKEVRTFPHEGLADYLADCREKSCILCYNPASFFHNVMNFPSAAGKFYDQLVRAEVRKSHQELTSFTLFHRILGEVTSEGAPYRKVVAFSYPDAPIFEVISTFNKRGMPITHLYAAPYAIFKLAASTCTDSPATARIFIAALPGEKLFLMSENGELGFLRKVPSQELALLPADVNNLNMTIDYCLQTLRVKPAEAVMLNPGPMGEANPSALAIPFKSAEPQALAGVPEEVAAEYLAPLAAALHHARAPQECNILPADYLTFTKSKKIIAGGSLVLILLTLVMGIMAVRDRMKISALQSKISSVKTRTDAAVKDLAEYKKLDQEVTLLARQIAYLNRANAPVSLESALASLTLVNASTYAVQAVSLSQGDGYVGVRISGTVASAGFRETQIVYEGLVGQVSKLPGYAVTGSSVDVKLQTFTIEARYSGAGQQQGT